MVAQGALVAGVSCYAASDISGYAWTPFQVLGIDPDSERLQVAKEKYPASNLEYKEGSGEDIPGTDYDIVFSNSVLHWCKNKDLVFKQVNKSLKEGGTFGFVTPADFDPEKQFFSPANMFSSECRQAMLNDVHHISSYEFLQLAADNNFSLIYFKKHFRKWRFEDVNALVVFHLTHYKGQFSSSHFNTELMKEHYGDGEIVISIPYITVIVVKGT